MPDAVPTLDAGSTENTRFAHDLAAAYEEYGFVIIQNHGIDKRVIDQCLACFRRFFALPEAEKRRYQVPGGGGARGLYAVRHRNRQGRHAPRSQGVLARRPRAAARSPVCEGHGA